MKTVTTLLCLSTLASMANAATEFSVNVYDGPKECEDADKIKPGDYVNMHYQATIDESSETGEKGLVWENSRDHNPFLFQIGNGAALKCWEEGLMGVCQGAKVILVCPPDMGFGDAGAGDVIPGGASLKFDMEILDVSDQEPAQGNLFLLLDQDEDLKISKEEFEAFFSSQGAEAPEGMFENSDADGDGFLSWEEFPGPKGDAAPEAQEPETQEAKDEL